MKKDEIVEQLANGKMSRRQFNRNLMALGATMVMMPLGSRLPQLQVLTTQLFSLGRDGKFLSFIKLI